MHKKSRFLFFFRNNFMEKTDESRVYGFSRRFMQTPIGIGNSPRLSFENATRTKSRGALWVGLAGPRFDSAISGSKNLAVIPEKKSRVFIFTFCFLSWLFYSRLSLGSSSFAERTSSTRRLKPFCTFHISWWFKIS